MNLEIGKGECNFTGSSSLPSLRGWPGLEVWEGYLSIAMFFMQIFGSGYLL